VRIAALPSLGLVAVVLSGCFSDDSVYSSGGDEKVKRKAQAVVLRNLTALDRSDGRTFCSTYTPRFLRTYRGSYASCVASFLRRPHDAPAPRIRFTDFLTASDSKVAVAFRSSPKSSVQTYYLKYTTPPPQVGRGKRWLIDQEAVDIDS
jgi:hypothetical protein